MSGLSSPLPPTIGAISFIIPCRPVPGTEKAGGHLPAQGVQDAPEQEKDHEGDDRHALNMAALRLPRLLRQPHTPK